MYGKERHSPPEVLELKEKLVVNPLRIGFFNLFLPLFLTACCGSLVLLQR